MPMQQMTLGELRTNSYIVWDTDGQGVLIDPADEADRLLRFVREHNLTIHYVLLTHAHYDHMLAAADIQRETGAVLALHEADVPALNDPDRNLAGWFGPVHLPPLTAGQRLRDGDTLTAGALSLTVWHTPGHTPGSCCYYMPAKMRLFSGDTLFAGSAGRIDFPGGSLTALQSSLRRLMELPDDVRVYPGHEEMTTIGVERRDNPFIG